MTTRSIKTQPNQILYDEICRRLGTNANSRVSDVKIDECAVAKRLQHIYDALGVAFAQWYERDILSAAGENQRLCIGRLIKRLGLRKARRQPP